MDPDSSAGNSCIRLLTPPVMYLSIQEGKIFGEGPQLQTPAANKCPTQNGVPSATETIPKAGSYPVLSFPEKNWCLVSLSASIIKININWKTSVCLSWHMVLIKFFTSRTKKLWNLCQLLRYQSNMGWQLSSSRGYFRPLLVPAWNVLCVNSDLLFTAIDEVASTNQKISQDTWLSFDFIRKISFWTVWTKTGQGRYQPRACS